MYNLSSEKNEGKVKIRFNSLLPGRNRRLDSIPWHPEWELDLQFCRAMHYVPM